MSVYVDIKKKLGDFTLDVRLETGDDTLALLGASGCGKSMTLKCIAGIETPDEGIIRVGGRTLFDSRRKINLPPQKRRVGYLFQNYALFPGMTVRDNIASGIKLRKNERGKIVKDKLKTFFLSGLGDRYPHQLSGGQQQRVALARIFASDPDILMLDEPFSALDSHLRWHLEQEMKSILSDFPGTSLLVSHNRDEVYRICDKIAVMSAGKTEVQDEKWALFHDPRTRAAALLTGCKNISRASRVDAHTVFAEDWRLPLHTEREVPEDVRYVGVRAHILRRPQGQNKTQNVFPLKVFTVIEDTFSFITMLQSEDLPEPQRGAQLRWEQGKENWIPFNTGDTISLSLPPEHILMLTG